MPNHCINCVCVTGDNAVEIMKKYFRHDLENDNKMIFDFELIIPTPENADWYSFHNEKWGTKWNSYELEIEDYANFKFQTAWNSPNKIFLRLSEIEPTLTFTVDFADEDIGSNCGSYIINEGENIKAVIFPSVSKLSEKFAKDLWGYDEESDDDTDESDDDTDDTEDDENNENLVNLCL